jgi:hypothetical protein
MQRSIPAAFFLPRRANKPPPQGPIAMVGGRRVPPSFSW